MRDSQTLRPVHPSIPGLAPSGSLLYDPRGGDSLGQLGGSVRYQ